MLIEFFYLLRKGGLKVSLTEFLTLLEALKLRQDTVLALLTGTLARGAEIKLRHYGVWHYFQFGAHADDTERRFFSRTTWLSWLRVSAMEGT